jgi:hypothetical protein
MKHIIDESKDLLTYEDWYAEGKELSKDRITNYMKGKSEDREKMTTYQYGTKLPYYINVVMDVCFRNVNGGKITLDQVTLLSKIHVLMEKQSLEICPPHIYVLDSPTGSGKTESFILAQ